MSHRLYSLLVVGLGLSFAKGAPADDAVELPAKENLHVYLLIGQSNMAGRGVVEDQDKVLHPRVLKLDQHGKWVPATDPLHFDKPQIAGVGPGSSFGPAMAEANESATIGLVPAAVGGTPLSRWQKEGDLYQAAVKRAKAALRHGTLKGIIWHQGEAESGKREDAESYAERLSRMIADLRQQLDAPDVPFVVGKLGEFLPDRVPFWETVNEQLASIPERVPHTACVESSGLKAKADQVHFDANSAREFGRRYAEAMLRLQR